MTPLIVFDLDGTLVDTKKDIALSLNHALVQEGFAPLAHDHIAAMVGKGARQLVEEALGNPPAEDLQRVFVTFLDHYADHLLDHSEVYPGVEDFLMAHAQWNLAVVTNKPERHTQKMLAGLNLERHFFAVIGGDTLVQRKPHPSALEVLEQQVGPWEQGFMVGDSLVDLEFGRAGGLITCLLTHGFGLATELEAGRPDYLVEDFLALAQLPIFVTGSAQETKG